VYSLRVAFTTEKAREQAERILEFLALGADGAAVIASRDGELMASSRREHHEHAADELARAAVARRGALPVHVAVHPIHGSAAFLVVASSPTISFGVLQQRTARALMLLRRMLASAPDPTSGAPAELRLPLRARTR
jgi:hypothetical protein